MSLYGALWRHLPGPIAVRVAILVLLAVGVVYGLFAWVFPVLEPLMPGNDITVDQ